MKRSQASPEERAAEEAQQAKDDAELLDWYENHGGKAQQLHPLVEANVRLAKDRREPPADNSATLRREWEAAAANAAKPAQPLPEVNALDEAPQRQPVIIQRQREPQSIFEALDRPTRDSQQVGESYGSWHREPI
jgi:hypothetical protein